MAEHEPNTRNEQLVHMRNKAELILGWVGDQTIMHNMPGHAYKETPIHTGSFGIDPSLLPKGIWGLDIRKILESNEMDIGIGIDARTMGAEFSGLELSMKLHYTNEGSVSFEEVVLHDPYGKFWEKAKDPNAAFDDLIPILEGTLSLVYDSVAAN